MRLSIKAIDNFYSPDVVFEDSMARCPWEAGVNVDSDSDSSTSAEAEPQPHDFPEDERYTSAWSNDSDSEMVFATQSAAESSWADSESYNARRDSYTRSMSPSPASPLFAKTKLFEAFQTPTNPSTYSVLSSSPSIPSLPVTPNNGQSTWSQAADSRAQKKLTLDTDCLQARYYDSSVAMLSARSSSMHTALESQFEGYGLYSPYLAESIPEKASLFLDSREDLGMIATPITAGEDADAKSTYSFPTIDADNSMSAARPESPVLGLSLGSTSGSITAVERSEYNWDQLYDSSPSPSPEPPMSAFSFLTFTSTPAPSPQSEHGWPFPGHNSPSEPRSDRTTHAFSFFASHPSPPPLPIRPPLSPSSRDRKTRTSSFLNPIRLAFPRRSSSPLSRCSVTPRRDRGTQTESAPTAWTSWAFSQSTSSSPSPQPYSCLPPPPEKGDAKLMDSQVAQQRRKRRSWFSPSKLFAAVLP